MEEAIFSDQWGVCDTDRRRHVARCASATAIAIMQHLASQFNGQLPYSSPPSTDWPDVDQPNQVRATLGKSESSATLGGSQQAQRRYFSVVFGRLIRSRVSFKEGLRPQERFVLYQAPCLVIVNSPLTAISFCRNRISIACLPPPRFSLIPIVPPSLHLPSTCPPHRHSSSCEPVYRSTKIRRPSLGTIYGRTMNRGTSFMSSSRYLWPPQPRWDTAGTSYCGWLGQNKGSGTCYPNSPATPQYSLTTPSAGIEIPVRLRYTRNTANAALKLRSVAQQRPLTVMSEQEA
ncbi:hypothetical protein DFH06DRAFT_1210871 [Mycena polygramma]|nr:hypothetical protein DFH06DRAFT_1210871 [Mycena polygramma]